MIAVRQDGGTAVYHGVYPAIVENIVDPDRLGRIQLSFPFLGIAGKDVRAWATLLTPYADDDQGFEMLPAKGTQVVVAFEEGSLRRPYILGSAWNGKEKLPQAPEAANNKRLIKTRSGSLLEFDDTAGAAKITISLKSGHRLELDDAAQQVLLRHKNGCLIQFDVAGSVTISAVGAMTINAPGTLTVNAPSTTFSGNVICMGLTATSVTSPLYLPGAGNVW